jgi:hypothetical protein
MTSPLGILYSWTSPSRLSLASPISGVTYRPICVYPAPFLYSDFGQHGILPSDSVPSSVISAASLLVLAPLGASHLYMLESLLASCAPRDGCPFSRKEGLKMYHGIVIKIVKRCVQYVEP